MSLEYIFNEFYTTANNINILSCVHSLNIIEYNNKIEYDTKFTNLFIESGKLLALSYILGDSEIFYSGFEIINLNPKINFKNLNNIYINANTDINKCLSSKDIAKLILNNSSLCKDKDIKNKHILDLINNSYIYAPFLLHGFSIIYETVCLNKNKFIYLLDTFNCSDDFVHIIKNSIHSLNSLDIKRQTDFISTIFTGNPEYLSKTNSDTEDFPLVSTLESAQYIADYIIESSIISYSNRKINRAWLGYTTSPLKNKKEIKILEDNLFDGTLGLVFFLLTLYKHTKIGYYLSISKEILDSVLLDINKQEVDSLKETMFLLDYYNQISNTKIYSKTLNSHRYIYKNRQFDIFTTTIRFLIKETPLSINNYSISDFKKSTTLHNLGLNGGLSSVGLKLLTL
ncbi:MAG: hypothetical protein RR620_09480 [Clostridium sp.]